MGNDAAVPSNVKQVRTEEHAQFGHITVYRDVETEEEYFSLKLIQEDELTAQKKVRSIQAMSKLRSTLLQNILRYKVVK